MMQKELWKEFGYQDNIVVTAEPFGLWVIERLKDISKGITSPRSRTSLLSLQITKPYKQRKVRILNEVLIHLSFLLLIFTGNEISMVRESMEDELIGNFMHQTIYDEVIPYT